MATLQAESHIENQRYLLCAANIMAGYGMLNSSIDSIILLPLFCDTFAIQLGVEHELIFVQMGAFCEHDIVQRNRHQYNTNE